MKKFLSFAFILFLTGNATAQLVYKDVAPIFFKHCTSCHNPYGHGAPFMNYTQTSSYAASIENKLVDSEMPPWTPDPTYTHFLHERIISKTDKNKILNWISGGALPGDTAKAPTPPVYTKYQINAPPDLELTIPTFTSNASTDDSYVCFSLPSGLTQDRIIRAFEIVAGNPSIVHHVIATVDTLAITKDDLSGHCFGITGDFSIGGFAANAPPCIFPARAPLKMGITIKKGSKIVLQVHYPAGSAGQKDNTKIRFYFYPVGATGVRPVIVKTLLENWDLNIPANTVRTFTASIGVGANFSGFAAFPHSHKLATTIVNYLYKGTDTIPIIRIKQWDFNWQGYYILPRLLKTPSGYTLFSSHTYDNTVNNPNNPNSPPKDVKAGTSTNDEMLYDSFQFLAYQPGDENIDIDSIIALDPITSVQEERVVSFRTYAYPNPFQQNVQIGYVLEKPAHVSVEIYSMLGGLIKKIDAGYEIVGEHEITWDAKSSAGIGLTNGTYLYVVKTDTEQSYGKLQLLSGSN